MSSTRRTLVTTTATVAAVLGVVRYLQTRARRRARKSVQRVKASLPPNKPLLDIDSAETRARVVRAAIKRASKWMTLSSPVVRPLHGQVGGASIHKKPLLTLDPDYVLKPLLGDHRGVREIAFYEAMALVGSKPDGVKAYRSFIKGSSTSSSSSTTTTTLNSQQKSSWLQRLGDWMDTLAVYGAFVCHDPIVIALEEELAAASKAVKTQLKKEADLLSKLSNLTAPYYGVWGQEEYDPTEPYGVDADAAHLLLRNITISYSCPCVMDLKLGTQTYEPDAPLAKRDREQGKYPSQTDIGFRIVGMRVYDPHHPEADGAGFRFWKKEYGRSLATMHQVKEALRQFFTIPVATATTMSQEEHEAEEAKKNGENKSSSATNGVKAKNSSPTNTTVSSSSPPPPDNSDNEPLLRIRAISSLLLQVRSIRRWFEENDSFKFYASSLLIVYEGDRSASDVTAAKMIDFGRVRREAGGDKGYQHGLRNLKHLLVDLLDEEEERLGNVPPR